LDLVALFAAQAALVLEDHGLPDDLEHLRDQAVGALARAIR
jgi:hypothetical protein